jgi:hypothetical protein
MSKRFMVEKECLECGGGEADCTFLFPLPSLLPIFFTRLPIVLVVLDLLIQLDRLAVEIPPEGVENNPRHVIGVLDAFPIEPPGQSRATPYRRQERKGKAKRLRSWEWFSFII